MKKIVLISFTRILSIYLCLIFFTIITRGKTVGFAFRDLINPKHFIEAFLFSHYDILFLSSVTLVFILLVWASHSNIKIFEKVFLIFSIFLLLISTVNIDIVKKIGTPFNIQWLYYSDFLNSHDAASIILDSVSGWMSIVIISLMTGMLLMIYTLSLITKRLRTTWLKVIPLSALLVFAAYFFISKAYVKSKGVNPFLLANPIVAFSSSLYLLDSPGIFTRKVSDHLDEFKKNNIKETGFKMREDALASSVKNIIFFVLESVPANATEDKEVMPNLNQYKDEAISFDNIYAHSPSTANAMISMLSSVYPWISYKSLSAEHPDINLPTITSELKRYGYQSTFINSSDNGFQGMNRFLAGRGFSEIHDYKTLPCENIFKAGGDMEAYLDGIDDECLVDSFFKWVSKETKKPFFAMLWTMQTHYPYFFNTEEKDFNVVDRYHNRYLNALHHSDMVFGKLMEGLKKKDLYESTIVIVIGDHGEAFNTHNQYGHGSAIYEENVHVPCIFVNPILFNGEKETTVGGHIDIAPTLFDILNYTVPEEWQGESLFSRNRDERAYFFAPWTDFKFGYRQQSHKVILNETRQTVEVYNLLDDPKEMTNIAQKMPALVDSSYDRLASWVQYHQKYIDTKLKWHKLQIKHYQKK